MLTKVKLSGMVETSSVPEAKGEPVGIPLTPKVPV